jgi:hypothetical protein
MELLSNMKRPRTPYSPVFVDPNEYYRPTGSVRQPDYAIWAYQSLAKPAYFITNDVVLTEDIPFSNTAKYSFEIEFVPTILKTHAINLKQHFAQEFSAPRPTVEYPAEPVPIPGPDYYVSPHPEAPVRKEKPSKASAVRILTFGLFDLYWVLKTPFCKADYQRRLKAWRSQCRQIDEGNEQERQRQNRHYESLPAVQSYKKARLAYESYRKALAMDLDQAAIQWNLKKRDFDSARLTDIKRFLAAATAPEDALLMTLNATPFWVHVPRNYTLKIDAERKMGLVEIRVPAAFNVVFTQKRQLVSDAKTVEATKRDESYWYNYLIYSMLIRTVSDFAMSPFSSGLDSITANVVSQFKNPADGLDNETIIASFVVSIKEAHAIDLQHIDPVETFRSWGGIAIDPATKEDTAASKNQHQLAEDPEK